MEFFVFLVIEKFAPEKIGEASTKFGAGGAPIDDGKFSEIQVRTLAGVLLGDFMHNLVDGIVIGIAFTGCGKSFGWGITASTIYHELAQEVSDYLVLTDPHLGNLSSFKALSCNFVS